MSNDVANMVMRRRVGSPTRKAVLLFMAGRASDDGTGVYTSKSNMARDLEMGRRTVQKCIDDLVSEGLISESGTRPCSSGLTVEYRLNLTAIEALPDTREPVPSRAGGAHHNAVQDVHTVQEVHGGCAGRAHQAVQDVHTRHPITIHEPSNKIRANKKQVEAEEAVEIYNAAAKETGWPKVQRLTKPRISAIAGRLKEVGGMDGWRDAIARARASPFLTGQTSRPFLASFDFLTKPKNLTKLMEGNYDPRPTTRRDERTERFERATQAVMANLAQQTH